MEISYSDIRKLQEVHAQNYVVWKLVVL